MTAPSPPNVSERLRFHADRVEEDGYVNAARYMRGAADDIDHITKVLALQEAAETAHVNCDECNGEEVPELCPKCFPLFDDARIARRLVLASPTNPTP